jgi:CubicO group peptidase (beta-lactamase class C family)
MTTLIRFFRARWLWQSHPPSVLPLWVLALLLIEASGVCRPVAAAGVEPASDPDRVVVTGRHDPRLASFDRLFRQFMARHKVPGAAVAVSRRGRLVYARGFGYADLGSGGAVRPDALFRIASVSKPITSAAVLALVDRGKLGLDDRVLDRLGPGFDAPPADPRWRQITLREVLQHRGGWDRDRSFDPMFRPVLIARRFQAEPPAGPRLVIRYMLGQPLDFDPGARSAYSNFGYCVLGRVIERATGEPYEAAVGRLVLRPLGLTPRAMRLGRTLPGGRAPGEVHYHGGGNGTSVFPPLGRPVPEPYGAWNLEAMDAHGGWLATAPALVRFASSFDGSARSKVLSGRAIATLFERPPGSAGASPDGRPRDAYYGCGWNVRPVAGRGANTWHTGSLPGTSTLLVRRWDGLNWAVLFNTRDGASGVYLADAIDPLVHGAADAVAEWPDVDLFATEGRITPAPRRTTPGR